MKHSILPLLASAAFLPLLAGCDRTPPPAPTPSAPAASSPAASRVDDRAARLARLDEQIADLQAKVDASSGPEKADLQAKLDTLKARRDELKKNYDQARYDQLESDTKDFFARVGDSIKHGAQATGDAAQSAGDKIKDTVNGNNGQ